MMLFRRGKRKKYTHPKQAFADSFQKLYESCQQCVVKEGDYFEGQ
jgi:hypothetical protein